MHMKTPKTPLIRWLQFLGKVQFTTVLLLGGAIIMTAGTVLESRGSREIAWAAVYGTAWFDVFLFLIGVNLIVAVINRIPIRRQQWPFVLTHFAIVVLLVGAWISRTWGFEGRLFIDEGSREQRLYLDASEIRTRWTPPPDTTAGGEVVEARFALPPHRPWADRVLREEDERGPGIRIAEYIPDGVLEYELREAGPPNPAGVEFLLTSGQQQLRSWLIADDPSYARRDLGALEVELRQMDSKPTARPAKPRIAVLLGPSGELLLQASGPDGVGPLRPTALGRSESIAGFGLRVERVIAHASPTRVVSRAPPGGNAGGKFVRLETVRNGARQSVWLDHTGNFRELSVQGGGTLALAFGPQRRELPFAVALEAFELIRYPGSTRPAEFRSRVRVEPAAANQPAFDAVISMNRPLDVEGFRLFQSSYRLGESGGPDTTILSVAHDPGVGTVYIAFALLILGIAWGLRGVGQRVEQPVYQLERHGSVGAPSGGGISRARKRALAPAARRAGARELALLVASLIGLASGLALRAQAAVEPAAHAAAMPVDATRGWAIMADGRVKPLVTYAKELALAVIGRERHDGLDALEIFWGYALDPRDFMERPYVRVDGLELKAALGLPAQEKRFSFNELARNPTLPQLAQRASERQRREEALSRLDQDALETYGKLQRLAALASGEALAIVPIVDASGAWTAPAKLGSSADPAARAIAEGFGRLAAAYANRDADSFRREANALTVALRNANASVYPSKSELARELFYEDFNAFGKAWVLYLLGFLTILLFGFSSRPWGYATGMALIFAGFACHSIGLGTRWLIAGRAPVSNMYESLVFMGWGAIAIGLVPEILYRKRFLAMAAGLMGFVCLVFAENLPIDPAIDPLVPVLAHTYWLSVHVMTVMLSYSAFAIAMVLGHAMLAIELVFKRERVDLLTALSKLLYKTLQVGVLFLAAGIVFGAVWANESWGRYWGWDPKETWSLITFFVYLAIIHARYAGWLRHFGLAASSILGFLAVVMTYYGVNFILAAGMHAYGFSEGGQLYVAIYVAVELAIVTAAWLRYGAAKKAPSSRVDAQGLNEV